MKILKLKKGAALVIVAHPDDETIWMGGTILRFRNIKWTIFCLTRSYDSDRAPRFKRACKAYGAKCVISDLEDEGLLNIRRSVPEIERRLRNILKQTDFDYIFTHGYNGEYGHPRHKAVHLAVKKLIARKFFKAKNLFVFAYRDGKPMKNSNFTPRLSRKIFGKKRAIINRIYNFKPSSFEYRICAPLESFRYLRVQ